MLFGVSGTRPTPEPPPPVATAKVETLLPRRGIGVLLIHFAIGRANAPVPVRREIGSCIEYALTNAAAKASRRCLHNLDRTWTSLVLAIVA